MSDLLYVAMTVALLAASWGLMVVCDRLMEEQA